VTVGRFSHDRTEVDRTNWAVVAAIGGVYLSQSMVSGLSYLAIPAALRASGMSLAGIGLFSLLLLPWVLKFLWAPAVERWRMPTSRPLRSRHIVALCQMAGVGLLLLLAIVGTKQLVVLFVILVRFSSPLNRRGIPNAEVF
jgi:MFS transporter (putative signal transducer)